MPPVSKANRKKSLHPSIRSHCTILLLLMVLFWTGRLAHADDMVRTVKKAVERSTLDQTGTKPFHLKATLKPSFERDEQAGLTGDIEIWWASPRRWRREIHTPHFSQTMIVDGDQEWQKNDGDYFPEWLREVAVALVEPVPNLNHILEQVKGCDVRMLMRQINCSWMEKSSDGNVESSMGAGIAINGQTGLLNYGSGLGWSAGLKSFADFHGRQIARTVQSDAPEVTATITLLED